MALQKKIVIAALAIASIMMIASVVALLTSTKTVPSSGTISAFKVTVYENDTTTLVITPFIFDSVGNGSSTYRDIFVKNAAGNKGMTLGMTTDTWVADPSNSSGPDLGVTLTWNYTSGVLTPGTGEGVRLTLSAADNTQTRTGLSFTVKINIIGTETS
jgi:hypothetical protein